MPPGPLAYLFDRQRGAVGRARFEVEFGFDFFRRADRHFAFFAGFFFAFAAGPAGEFRARFGALGQGDQGAVVEERRAGATAADPRGGAGHGAGAAAGFGHREVVSYEVEVGFDFFRCAHRHFAIAAEEFAGAGPAGEGGEFPGYGFEDDGGAFS